MNSECTPKNRWQPWGKGITKASAWLYGMKARGGVRSPHSWAIAAMMAALALLYYAEQIFQVSAAPFTTVHDIHRALFLIPVVYAALMFRVKGGLIASFAFLGILLPRALLFSTYPDPLFRALTFFILTILVSLLIAVSLNQLERAQKARDELEQAYEELSACAQRLKEGQEQLIQAEKLTSLGQMAAAIAHEINNPLAGVLVYTKLLSKKLDSDSLSKQEAIGYLSRIESELNHSSRIIRNLLDFARQTQPELRVVDINQVIEQALSVVGHQAKLQHIEVINEFSPSLPQVKIDADKFRQVFVNLTMNAIQAMPDGGRLTLRTSIVDDGQLRVDVQDTGCGISKENMGKLFTPFFTTKERGRGVGLGLAVVHGIIQQHNARIEVDSEVGRGTTFTIYLGAHHE